MFWHNSHTRDLIYIGYAEVLETAIIFDVPDIYDSFGVASYKTFETWRAVYTNQWVLMTLELYDLLV